MTEKNKKIIRDSERDGIPIFVLTAKDANSIKAISTYLKKCSEKCSLQHTAGVAIRLLEFSDWQQNNPDRVKLPD